jgi:site-specific recombinase XerD
MVRKGYDLESIATMMGHNDIQTTHKFYAVCQNLISTDADKKLIDELKKRGVL